MRVQHSVQSVLGATLLAALAVGLPAWGQTAATVAEWPPYVEINTKTVDMPTSPAILTVGEIMVPLEDLFAVIGGKVVKNAAANSYTITRGAAEVALTVGNPAYSIGGKTLQFTVFPVNVGDVTYVDLRDLITALGGKYSWDRAKLRAVVTIDAASLAVSKVTGSLVYLDKRQKPPFFLVTPEGAAGPEAYVGADPILYLRTSAKPEPDPSSLEQLALGANVELGLDREGKVVQVTLLLRKVTGAVEFVSNTVLLMSTDGARQHVTVPRGVPCRTEAGKAYAYGQIKKGDRVTVFVDETGKTAQEIVVHVGGGPVITLVELVGYTKPLKKGETVTVRLRGPAGGQASFNIGDAVQDVAMDEQPAGIYQGVYTVDREFVLLNAPVVGKLVVNGAAGNPVAAKQTVTIDTQPPVVTSSAPAQDAQLSPGEVTISAKFSDREGSGINPAGAKLVIDGAVVTAGVAVTEAGLTYTTRNLAEGGHEYNVTIADLAGNTGGRRHQFTVANPQSKITSVEHDAAGPLSTGEVLTVTLKATEPGRSARFTIGGNWAQVNMTRVGNTGTFTGTYTVVAGKAIDDAPVLVYFVDNAGATHQMAAATKVTVAGTVPTALAVTAPEEGYRHVDTGEKLVVSGKAPPGRQVRVLAKYLYFFDTKSNDSDTVTADAFGLWATKGLNLKLSGFKAAFVSEFTIVAELLRADGTVETTVEVKVPIGEAAEG